MWVETMIPMYMLWLHRLHGLHGPCCPLSDKSRKLNHSLMLYSINYTTFVVLSNEPLPWRIRNAWWRHQMETFSALLALCAGNSPVTSEFHSQGPLTRRCDVFFDRGLKKSLSKQSRRCWFETASCSLWRHCNEWVHTGWNTDTKEIILIVAWYNRTK